MTKKYHIYGTSRTAAGSVSAYQFSRKEKDATGLYYFGKRYYRSEAEIRQLPDDPAIGRWLSVDPMADKYPSLSPYNYCAGNPLKYVDPSGLNIINFDSFGVYIDYTEDDYGWDNVTANVNGTTYQFNDPKWTDKEGLSLIHI